jgi:uncharacterized protein YdaT
MGGIMANNKGNQHHVVKHDAGWAVKRSGSDRPSVVTDTKQQAVNQGRTISKNQGTELVIHKQDGTIQRSDSHGRDPNPPKDKK